MIISKKLAETLARVKKITDQKNSVIIRSAEIKRSDRELLAQTQWLQEIIKGWYMLIRPDTIPGDSATWYANFWDFLRIYLKHRFNNHYCLSAETSLELHVDTPIIPKQVIVIAPHGGNSIQKLPYDTSMLIYADPKNIPQERIEKSGLQVMPIELALCKVTSTYFREKPQDAEIALRLISPSNLSRTIISYDFKRAAERLIGAYEFLGELKIANNIKNDLNSVGIKVNVENPFKQTTPSIITSQIQSPYAARIQSLWNKNRHIIIKMFPKPPGLPKNIKKYLSQLDEIYEFDAYNSLSIEGYQVTKELIEHVKNNQWNPDLNLEDQQERNTLAARGYFEAFQTVKKSVLKILQRKNPGTILKKDLQIWYQNLFSPNVQAGIISPAQLIGYRNNQVYIRGSRHVPPSKEAVIDAMETLFNCIKTEPHAGVRAILGHYLFVFIHPYMDGNGRISRFLMNTMLASGGYFWTIIENAKRTSYINSLRIADETQNLIPFTEFIIKEMEKSKKYIQ